MFTIKPANHGNGIGWDISTGDRSPVTAYSVAELHEAIDHYFASYRHTHTTTLGDPCCPFCYAIRQKELQKGVK